MAALLCSRFPEKGPELFAYLQTIVAAERNYEANQWVTYDRKYRRQALNTRDLDWSLIDSRLYQSIVSGRARAVNRCGICLHEDYHAESCSANPQNVMWQQVPTWSSPYPASGVMPGGQSVVHPQAPQPQLVQPQVCRRFNKGTCRAAAKCKYKHVCLKCGEITRRPSVAEASQVLYASRPPTIRMPHGLKDTTRVWSRTVIEHSTLSGYLFILCCAGRKPTDINIMLIRIQPSLVAQSYEGVP